MTFYLPLFFLPFHEIIPLDNATGSAISSKGAILTLEEYLILQHPVTNRLIQSTLIIPKNEIVT
jgi:hypothetical protein